jgi:flagellin
MNNSIKQMLNQINQFAQSATFNGINLVATTGTGVGAATGGNTMNVVDNIGGSTLSVSNSVSAAINGSAVTASDSTGLGLTGLSVTTGALKIATSSSTLPVTGDSITLKSGAGVSYTYVLNDGTATTSFATAGSATQDNREVQIGTTDSTATILTKLSQSMAADGFSGTTDSSGNFIITGNSLTLAGSSSTLTGATSVTSTGTTAGDAIATVNAAIKQLNVNASYLGSINNQITGMHSFSTSLSDSLTAGIGALTDANMAAESAKLQSLQTKQSLAIQSLSIANQQPQSIMTLFR